MSKVELLHEFYASFKNINFNEADDIAREIETDDEKAFFRVVSNYVLQQKQKRVIAEKRF
ncbi:hypothetical protein SAMN02910358_00299 [Lachnospiraceae bacterium XBB1006]|nr:hypothetical protein SAMN02910358_00299 [Lachnospiraceae bacterium XBB1006]